MFKFFTIAAIITTVIISLIFLMAFGLVNLVAFALNGQVTYAGLYMCAALIIFTGQSFIKF